MLLNEIAAKRIYLGLSGPTTPKRNDPFVTIDVNGVWDKGAPEEKVYPTLSMIKVPEAKEGQGLGFKLVKKTLQWMVRNNIKFLVFDNYNKGFWDSIEKKLPGQLAYRQNKRLGILKATPKTNVTSVF